MQSKNGYYTLNSGNKIPAIALGTLYATTDEATDIVVNAIDTGYKAIDTASGYGNEEGIGKGLKSCFDSGKIKREDIFITTKVWNDAHGKEDLRKSCLASLEKLQLDYLDLLLVHTPISGVSDFANHTTELSFVPLSETWAAMEQLVQDGLVKNIGLSNFNVQLVLDLLSYAKIKPATLQVELHPYHPQTELVQWCASQGILCEAYCPLFLGSAPGFGRPDLPKLIEREEIKEIAARLGKTPAQIVLAWGISRGTRVLPKSANPTRMAENLEATSFTLEQADLDKIEAIPDRGAIVEFGKILGVPIFS